MKKSFFPEKITAKYIAILGLLFIIMSLPVLAILESYFPKQLGNNVLQYFVYPLKYKYTKNVVKSFQNEPPKYFIDLFNRSKQGLTKKEIVKKFHVNIFDDGRTYLGEDLKNYGQIDYFATATEFLEVGSGSCSEYATARYHTLLKMGYKTSVILGYGLTIDGGHAVTVVQIDGVDYILDINYPSQLVEYNKWMKHQEFIIHYIMDTNGLHFYNGSLYPVS